MALGWPLGVGAQSTSTYTNYDSQLTLTYPAEWELLDRDGQIVLEAPDGSTFLLTPAPASELGLTRQSTPQAALDFFITYFTTGVAEFEAQAPLQVNGQPAVYLLKNDPSERAILLVLQGDHGDFLFLAAVSTSLSASDLTQQSLGLLEQTIYRPPLRERWCHWLPWGCNR
jgi:hypothetical protein